MNRNRARAFLAATLILGYSAKVGAQPLAAREPVAPSLLEPSEVHLNEGYHIDVDLKKINIKGLNLTPDPGVAELDQWMPASPNWKPTPAPSVEVEKPADPVPSVPPAAEPSPAPQTSPANATEPAPPLRRAKPQPLDDVFPLTEWLGPTIGVPDSTPIYPLTKALWNAFPELKDANIRAYGWVNPSYNISSSRESNYPLSYNLFANRFTVDQTLLRIERPVDTVQTDHVDVGFRITGMYGTDYRFTTAQGVLSDQLLKNNQLYGFDPFEAYMQIYVPQVADGMVLTVGRYISPPDIEAQTSANNFLFTHSLMFTVDVYTFTGVKAEIKLNDTWSIMAQLNAGGDVAPWNPAARLTGGAMVRWVSDDNRDSIWAGINSINGASFNNGHDQLNTFLATWSHKFNDQINTMTEVYYEFVRDGLVGGTVNNGPAYNYYRNVGAGARIPGSPGAVGIVNYTNFKLDDKSYVTFRTDYLNDPYGQRTGFPTSYGSLTLGYIRNLTPLITVRPEIRYEKAFANGVTPYDNGTKSSQTTFNVDAIFHF